MQCDLHPKHGVQCSRAEDDASYTAIPLTFEEFFVCFSVVCDWCMIDLVPVILAMHYLLHTFLCVCVCVSLSVCGFFRVFLGVGSLHFRSKNSLIRLHAAPLRCSNWRLRIEIGSSSVGAACLPACLPRDHTRGDDTRPGGGTDLVATMRSNSSSSTIKLVLLGDGTLSRG